MRVGLILRGGAVAAQILQANFSAPQIVVNPKKQKIIGDLHSREARMPVENSNGADWKLAIVGRPHLPLTNANIAGLSVDLTQMVVPSLYMSSRIN